MARLRNFSKVQIPPRVKGFIPIGYYAGESEPLQLNIEEYEAIRLLDYENLSQEAAALVMEISRPTLTRIYDRARKKVASALTESRQIKIEGGRAIFSSNWFECESCLCRFNNTRSGRIDGCPLCASEQISIIGEENQI